MNDYVHEKHLAPLRQPRLCRAGNYLERFAVWTTTWVGSSWAFITAFLLVIVWLVSGPVFRFSDTWQLVMNTISSIVTFLMVFLLQRSQNKEALAMQVKLNEILAAMNGASNRLINIEDFSEGEVRALHERYQQLVNQAEQTKQFTVPRSIEKELANDPAPAQHS